MLGKKCLSPVQIVGWEVYPAECTLLPRVGSSGDMIVAPGSCFATLVLKQVPLHLRASIFLEVDDIGIVSLRNLFDVMGQRLDEQVVPWSQ